MSKNILSQNVLEEIFNERIIPAFASQIMQQESPAAIIFGGQPGSGKSALIADIKKQNNTYIVINGDDLRGFHPQMIDLMEKDEENAADLMQMDCNYWTEKLIAYCLANKTNMIIEGTMRRPEVPLNTAKILKMNGYTVEANILAAHPMVSLASIFYRYEIQKHFIINARFTKIKSHDESSLHIPDTLNAIFKSEDFDKIKLFSRLNGSTKLIYENTLVEKSWVSDINPAAVFLKLTQRELGEDERTYVRYLWELSITMAKDRKADNQYLEMLKENAKNIEKGSEKSKELDESQ